MYFGTGPSRAEKERKEKEKQTTKMDAVFTWQCFTVMVPVCEKKMLPIH